MEATKRVNYLLFYGRMKHWNKNKEQSAMNLQSLIKSGESETLEFKEKFDERTVESAVAFANAKGGMILIGVSDKGAVIIPH